MGKWLDKSRAARSMLPYPSINIIYPSKRTVQESVLGEQVAYFLSQLTRVVDHFLSSVGASSVESFNGTLPMLRETIFTTPKAKGERF